MASDSAFVNTSSDSDTPNFKRVVLLGVNEISDFPRAATDTSRPLLDYVPRIPEGENTLPVVPILAWDADEKGFYTYIPVSDEAPLDDPAQLATARQRAKDTANAATMAQPRVWFSLSLPWRRKHTSLVRSVMTISFPGP